MWLVVNTRLNRAVFPNILQGKECAVIDTTLFYDEEDAATFRDDCNKTDKENGHSPAFEVFTLEGT